MILEHNQIQDFQESGTFICFQNLLVSLHSANSCSVALPLSKQVKLPTLNVIKFWSQHYQRTPYGAKCNKNNAGLMTFRFIFLCHVFQFPEVLYRSNEIKQTINTNAMWYITRYFNLRLVINIVKSQKIKNLVCEILSEKEIALNAVPSFLLHVK